jgi:hypothetical protein
MLPGGNAPHVGRSGFEDASPKAAVGLCAAMAIIDRTCCVGEDADIRDGCRCRNIADAYIR